MNNIDRITRIVQSENEKAVLKGLTSEEKIIGNIHAHEFLGNKLSVAPKIYYNPDGSAYQKIGSHYFYTMEYISGAQVQETVQDEWLLGEAAAKLHSLEGYNRPSSYNVGEVLKKVKTWFGEKPWKPQFDALLEALPDFDVHEKCFIHTDIAPHNAIIRDGKIIFIDLDDAGTGSKYIDAGYPLISQFVAYNKETAETHYKFDIAKAFLEGYCSVCKLSRHEYDLLWHGAVLRQIGEMKYYGEAAVEPIWHIINFGLRQKEKLLNYLDGSVWE